MTDTKHTPGPWQKIYGPHRGYRIVGPGPDNVQIGETYNQRESANAAWIVACVNGCDEAGIADPGVLPELVAAARDALHVLDHSDEAKGEEFPGSMKRSRAALRAALTRLDGRA